MLLGSKNLIFRGAPGTGKSFLAKQIAAEIVSNGRTNKYSSLTDDEKEQVEFVQFHPSYDYSDFVEGLRPSLNDDGTMGFELQNGIFKRFIEKAQKSFEDANKTPSALAKQYSVQEAMDAFFENINYDVDEFETTNKRIFRIYDLNEQYIKVFIPGNASSNKVTLKISQLRRMLESDTTFSQVNELIPFFGTAVNHQSYSYYYAIYKKIKEIKSTSKHPSSSPEHKKYVFIIDEINRGEISKIFGELFFAIDPGYRGKEGEVSTKYSNLHSDPKEKLYIPDNVYIIGTMNDIDRSVDSFDFAMRRRFRFIELKANERTEILDSLDPATKEEAVKRMKALNEAISNVEDLNDNYHIGPAYFLTFNTEASDQLWTDCLEPLLHEYVQGMYDEKEIMKQFAQAYGYSGDNSDGIAEDLSNQG